MSHLLMVNGTMGVGKTTTCRHLQKMLERSVFLDGDWCWDMKPFVVNDETKAMVLDNIIHLLQNFLNCSEFDYVIFCWVMHEQSIVDCIIKNLTFEHLSQFTLYCDEASLEKRIHVDIKDNVRSKEVLHRALTYLPLYEHMDTQKIDVSDIDALQAASIISKKVQK